MEVELKYGVPDLATFAHLRDLSRLGDYELHHAGEQHLVDHYLDTAGRILWRSGYTCRLRQRLGDGWRATVKSLGVAQGALHQREEHEVDVPPGALPPAWPDGPARRLVLGRAGAEPLIELFVIRQQRAMRAVRQGERLVAELSLDVGEIEARGQWELIREIEVELEPGGTLDDLRVIDQALQAYGLQPQPRSKFERALALLDTHKEV
ncbi:MAG: inorganic triphosphatase [Anaerolineales bacterium]